MSSKDKKQRKIQQLNKDDNISGEDFSEGVFNFKLLNGINAINTNFSLSKMLNVNFQEENMTNRSNFKNAKFNGASLTNVNFKNSIMNNTDFSNAILNGVNFENTELNNAKFNNIDTIRFVNFKGANLNGATFDNVELEKYLEDGHIEIDEKTIIDNEIMKRFIRGENSRNNYDSRRIKSIRMLQRLTNETECPICMDEFIIDGKVDVVLLHKNEERKKGKPHIVHTSDFVNIKNIPRYPEIIACPLCREEIKRPTDNENDIPLLDEELDESILETFQLEESQKRDRSQSSQNENDEPEIKESRFEHGQNWWEGGKKIHRKKQKKRKTVYRKTKKQIKKSKRKTYKKYKN